MTLNKENIAKKSGIAGFFADCRGMAATEFVIVFPMMFTLLVGVFEIGNAILANQKTIMASQIVADLIARQVQVNDTQIDEAIRAGELALAPMAITDFGIDIVSIQYDGDDKVQVLWRETRNMSPNADAVANSEGLGGSGDGALVVTAHYVYRPAFGNIIIDEVVMNESAFARGRRTSVVSRE